MSADDWVVTSAVLWEYLQWHHLWTVGAILSFSAVLISGFVADDHPWLVKVAGWVAMVASFLGACSQMALLAWGEPVSGTAKAWAACKICAQLPFSLLSALGLLWGSFSGLPFDVLAVVSTILTPLGILIEGVPLLCYWGGSALEILTAPLVATPAFIAFSDLMGCLPWEKLFYVSGVLCLDYVMFFRVYPPPGGRRRRGRRRARDRARGRGPRSWSDFFWEVLLPEVCRMHVFLVASYVVWKVPVLDNFLDDLSHVALGISISALWIILRFAGTLALVIGVVAVTGGPPNIWLTPLVG